MPAFEEALPWLFALGAAVAQRGRRGEEGERIAAELMHIGFSMAAPCSKRRRNS